MRALRIQQSSTHKHTHARIISVSQKLEQVEFYLRFYQSIGSRTYATTCERCQSQWTKAHQQLNSTPNELPENFDKLSSRRSNVLHVRIVMVLGSGVL